jgi:3',5'-cyclic AMP phosphodiesterase CpdA
MRTIVHISDLHFGAEDPEMVAALHDCITRLRPSVIAVSGDLTQRARRAQFAAASRFLRSLPFPLIVVPGNHDIPLYNVFSRFTDPLGGFRRHITAERFPLFADEEIAVVGVDTTRSFTVKDGGLRTAHVRRLVSMFDGLAGGVVKIVVCHHPFDPPTGRSARLTLPAPDRNAIATLLQHGADVFVTGHLHLSYTGHSAIRYGVEGRSALVVEAGTATSSRVRGESNSFNVLRSDGDGVSVERLEWDSRRRGFAAVHRETFVRTDQGWSPLAMDAVDH